MKGFGTDESAIIGIIGKRTPTQMQQISQAYKASYGKSLDDAFESETSGHFGDLCCGLTRPLALFDAECVKNAIKGTFRMFSPLFFLILPIPIENISFFGHPWMLSIESTLV